MITALNVARIAKLIALLGFVFPWVLVSCSGEPIAHLTGIDLATGGMHQPGPSQDQHGHPNLWVTLSLTAIVVGMVSSFLVKGRQAILAMMACAILALVASVIGVSSVVSNDQIEAPLLRQQSARSQSPGQLDRLNRVDLQYGYLMTVAGLLASIGACGIALSRRDGGPSEQAIN